MDDYLESSKTQIWSTAADVVTEAISYTKEQLQVYFDQTKEAVMQQITGDCRFSKIFFKIIVVYNIDIMQ